MQAKRNGELCIGSIFLSLHTLSNVNERLHLGTIFHKVVTATHAKNLNNYVLKAISDAFEELK